jgi:hypothetical protein
MHYSTVHGWWGADSSSGSQIVLGEADLLTISADTSSCLILLVSTEGIAPNSAMPWSEQEKMLKLFYPHEHYEINYLHN